VIGGDLVVCKTLSHSFSLCLCSFAKASEAAKVDWSSFTKGYFLNRDTLVAVLLLIDASVPPQRIDFDCANWLGRNNVRCFFVFSLECNVVRVLNSVRIL